MTRIVNDHGRGVETAAEPGAPARIVLDYVERHGIEHVAVGSHSRDTPARQLLGSVAASVVRRSPTSVITVR